MSVYLKVSNQDYLRILKAVKRYETDLERSRERASVTHHYTTPIKMEIVNKSIILEEIQATHTTLHIIDDQ